MKHAYRALPALPIAAALAACPDDGTGPPDPERPAAEGETSASGTGEGAGASASEDSAAAGGDSASAEEGETAPSPDPESLAAQPAPGGASGEYYIPGPTLAGWEPTHYSDFEPHDAPPEGYSHLAVITGRRVGLFSEPGDRFPSGIARTGGRIAARPSSGPGCSGGEWYEVEGGAHLCSTSGVHITEESFEDDEFASVTTDLQRTRRPDVSQPNLFQHGVAADGAPFLERLPSEDEARAIADGEVPGDLIRLRADGAYVLALTDEAESGGETFYQTIYGSFIHEDDVDDRPLSPMHGEWIYDADEDFPLVFTYRESALYCLEGDDASPCGSVAKHARFQKEGMFDRDGREFVLASDRLAVPRDNVRVVRPTSRPTRFADDDKWVHIDLAEQALVAYRGDSPVFATLISSGREGFHTPAGTWRVDRKYHSKTMRGTGGDGRPYQVQEVPWALYYDGNFAAHGAYWHENFGLPQSHGCVNIPPLDARWLYFWGEGEVPRGWHADKTVDGTGIHVTGQTPPDEPAGDDEEDRA